MTLPQRDDEFEDDEDQAGKPDKVDDKFDDYWASIQTNEQILEDEEKNPRRRGRPKVFSRDGVVDTRMCQTEVTIRAARPINESPRFESNVYVFLGGAELNRRGDGVDFPVARYLSRWGFTKDPCRPGVLPEWTGFYTSKRSKRKLLLNFSKYDAHIMAFFTTGQRLIVHCTGGNVGNTRSPAEKHDLHRTVGRAICWPHTKSGDMIAVCTPRSERFRKLTARAAKSYKVQEAGLRFFHVDRGGKIMGLEGLDE